MATCRVKRNDQGRITKVTNEDGTESRLYQRLAKHPIIQNEEEALDIFKNTLTDDIGINTQLTHRVNNQYTDSYKRALQIAKEGEQIQIGISSTSGFSPIININKTTDRNSLEGFINNAIENNLLSEEKLLTNQGYRYQSAGQTENAKIVNAEILRDDVKAYLGARGFSKDATTFDLQKTNDKSVIIDHDGNESEITHAELDELSYEQLQRRTPYALEYIAAREYQKNKPAYGYAVDEKVLPTRTESELQVLLMNLLNKMGVSVSSMNEYVRKYNVKNGVEPSANALADIANRVVAFHEGEMGLEALTEETMHFITEAMSQDQVGEILAEIHRTEEWNQYADEYRAIYSKQHEGQALEDMVRREVLGKVMTNAVLNNFSTEGKTQEQASWMQRALNVLTNFFERVQAYFQPQYRTQLNNYLDSVQEIIRAEEISDRLNTSNFEGNSRVLFSTANTPKSNLSLVAEKAVQTIREQIQTSLQRVRKGSSINQERIKALEEKLEDNQEISSVTDIVDLTNQYVTILSKAIDDSQAQNKPYVFSQEENVIYQSLKNQLIPTLNEIRAIIPQKTTDKAMWKTIDQSLEDVISDAGVLQGRAGQVDGQAIQQLIDKIMRRQNIPESRRAYLEQWITSAEADTNWFHTNFGMLTHSRDGLLNLAGTLQKDIQTQSNIRWIEATKQFQQTLKRLGVSEREIAQFVDGDFIVSEYDFNKFENVINNLEANLYKEVTDSDLSIEELIEAKKDRTLEPLTSEQENTYKRRLKESRNYLLERKYKDSYYQVFENQLSDLGISDEGSSYILKYYSDMSQFKRNAQRVITDSQGNEKMILDFSHLSQQDKAIRRQLMKDRDNAKSYYGKDGTLKKGLKYDHINDTVVRIDPNKELSRDAQIAWDLNKLDESLRDRNNEIGRENEGTPQIFLDTLREIDASEGREAALDFLRQNSFTNFSNEYWESLDLGTNVLEEALIQEGSSASIDVLEHIRNAKKQLKSILRVYRDKNNPAEFDVDSMPRVARETVKTLQQSLIDYNSTARKLTKNIEVNRPERTEDVVTERTVNQSYEKALQDQGIDYSNPADYDALWETIKMERDFALEHMTDRQRLEVLQAFESIRTGAYDSTVQKAMKELGININRANDTLLDDTSLLYQHIIRTRLLPYYRRYAPSEYNTFQREIENSNENLADIVESVNSSYPMIEVNANYSFFDQQQNQEINPNFIENFEGGYLQPRLDLNDSSIEQVINGVTRRNEAGEIINNEELGNFRNILLEGGKGFRSQKYQELFGNNTSSNLYQAYEAVLDYNRQGLDAMGMGNNYNAYTLPQIRHSLVERTINLARGFSLERLREATTEAMSFTEDEKIQGETSKFGQTVKIIPKMYVDRLNNPNEVSQELFYSLTMRNREGFQRQSRVDHYGDFMAIHDRLVNRTYKGKGEKPENTLKMFNSAMDYSLFGIKETATYPVETAFGTFDVAKLARNVLGFIKLRNLGLNVVIPITSYLTGRVTREIETWVGEHMDVRSQRLGDAEFRRHARDAFKEIGVINTESKLNVMGQYFGAFDLSDSLETSNYGWLMRMLPRSAMMLHSGSNFPIYGATLFGVLHDFRVVEGGIMRFNQFEQIKLTEGLSKKDIRNQWNSLETDALYNYINVENGQLTYDDAAIRNKVLNPDGTRMSDSQYENFKTERIDGIRSHISNVITNIDGQIPQEARVAAQRHFLMNFFMTHRGWLSIVASRRFKHRHLNTETGELEEGSYRTMWNFMGNYIKEYSTGNFTSFAKHWKNVYENLDPAEAQLVRRNMKRIGIEMTALNGLMLIGFLINGMADDEEFADNYGIQGLSYMFNRTLNELNSAQVGSVNEFAGVIESPFVGWNTVQNFADVGHLFSGEEVKYGTYKGLTERRRFLTKMVPGAKQLYDLSSAERVKRMRDTYMFYNSGNFNYTPLGNLYWLADEK